MLDKHTLETFVSQGLSQHAIAEQLNCGQSRVFRSLRHHNLQTKLTGRSSIHNCIQCHQPYKSHKTQQKYCSHTCQRRFEYERYIAKWLKGEEDGIVAYSISNYIRRWLSEQRGEECWQCGWSEKHPADGRVPIETDHIDGNYKNNTPENLRLLCPNCHSLTPTYKGRNQGNGRHARRERYQAGKSY